MAWGIFFSPWDIVTENTISFVIQGEAASFKSEKEFVEIFLSIKEKKRRQIKCTINF
jgi:hypothetical protein